MGQDFISIFSDGFIICAMLQAAACRVASIDNSKTASSYIVTFV
jgi:hypothetical protein